MPRLHFAAVNDVQEARRAVLGHQDFRFRRIEGRGQPFAQEAQSFRLHPVEGGMAQQEVEVGSDQGVGGGGVHKQTDWRESNI